MKRTLGVILAGVFLAGSVHAQTINACYNKKTGALRISAACKKTEDPISWSQGAGGEQGPKGDPGPQGPQGPQGKSLYVFDDDGQILGVAVDPSSKLIYDTQSGYLFFLDQRVDLLYEDTACQGKAYTTLHDIPGQSESFFGFDPGEIVFQSGDNAFSVADTNTPSISVSPTTDVYRSSGGLCILVIRTMPINLLNVLPVTMGFKLPVKQYLHLKFQ